MDIHWIKKLLYDLKCNISCLAHKYFRTYTVSSSAYGPVQNMLVHELDGVNKETDKL